MATQARFDLDVGQHVMAVICDHPDCRHLLFRKPGHSEYWFELTTWRGSLCVNGDMGTYVFRRTCDMFTFFRGSAINPQYWSGKCVASSSDKVEKFSMDEVRKTVQRAYEGYCADFELSAADRDELWWLLEDDVLGSDGYDAVVAALEAFSWRDFRFTDVWEYDFNAFTYRFIWCLRAIVWGIATYDEHKAREVCKPEATA